MSSISADPFMAIEAGTIPAIKTKANRQDRNLRIKTLPSIF
jgi:hypothetical protein